MAPDNHPLDLRLASQPACCAKVCTRKKKKNHHEEQHADPGKKKVNNTWRGDMRELKGWVPEGGCV